MENTENTENKTPEKPTQDEDEIAMISATRDRLNKVIQDIKEWNATQFPEADLPGQLMKLEEELPLSHVKHGRYRFFNALKPAAMYSVKEVADAAAATTMRWTLALWDEDQQELCVIKYKA